jgi:hypothetical protein
MNLFPHLKASAPQSPLRLPALAAMFAIGLALPAAAQSIMAQLPTLHVAECHDFKNNTDGTWTAMEPITVEMLGVASAINPGQSFPPGMIFSGHDLGKWLNQHCPVTAAAK